LGKNNRVNKRKAEKTKQNGYLFCACQVYFFPLLLLFREKTIYIVIIEHSNKKNTKFLHIYAFLVNNYRVFVKRSYPSVMLAGFEALFYNYLAGGKPPPCLQPAMRSSGTPLSWGHPRPRANW
jgi:hypothetical protein